MGSLWLLLLSSAMMFARDPMLCDAWISAYGSRAWLDVSAWLALAAAVAIGFRRITVVGAPMATLLGAVPIVFAGRGPLLYLPTLAAALAWLVVWLDGRNHHALATTLQRSQLTPHEHL
jgi:hypothetical protein